MPSSFQKTSFEEPRTFAGVKSFSLVAMTDSGVRLNFSHVK